MRPAIKIGNVVRYFDKQLQYHVEARVVKIELFDDVFPSGQEGWAYAGLYLTLDNDMCIHEDSVKVVL